MSLYNAGSSTPLSLANSRHRIYTLSLRAATFDGWSHIRTPCRRVNRVLHLAGASILRVFKLLGNPHWRNERRQIFPPLGMSTWWSQKIEEQSLDGNWLPGPYQFIWRWVVRRYFQSCRVRWDGSFIYLSAGSSSRLGALSSHVSIIWYLGNFHLGIHYSWHCLDFMNCSITTYWARALFSLSQFRQSWIVHHCDPSSFEDKIRGRWLSSSIPQSLVFISANSPCSRSSTSRN